MSLKPEDYKCQILGEINRFLDTVSNFEEKDVPLRLREAMRYALLAPGKRIRPLLVLLAAEICGGDFKNALPAAAAVEMIHSYSLIHDDLPAMDNDDLRRGRPTCHIQFDPATAILAGDALQAFAFQILANQISDKDTAILCVAELAQSIGPFGLVGGQQEDVSFSDHDLADYDSQSLKELDPLKNKTISRQNLESLLLRIHSRKTGALLSVSLKLGALIAHAHKNALKALELYGKALGLAFQISDDILDLVGNSTDLGKSPHKDAEQGKLTFISLWGLEKSKDFLQQYVDQARKALAIFDPDLPSFSLLDSLALSMYGRKK